MSYHGTGMRSSTSIKVPPIVSATERVSHWQIFGSRARAYYSAKHDPVVLPRKVRNGRVVQYSVRNGTVTRTSEGRTFVTIQPRIPPRNRVYSVVDFEVLRYDANGEPSEWRRIVTPS